jgi:hypothetical protein
MSGIHAYSFVEDLPSADALQKIILYCNDQRTTQIVLPPGFPKVVGGFGNIKKQIPRYIDMARNPNSVNISLVDLDARTCAPNLIKRWFGRSPDQLPSRLIFRVAVREIESWLIADRKEFSRFLGIPQDNFSKCADEIINPKEFLFSLLQNKGRRKWHRDMLPEGNAHIGPIYNAKLCEFIKDRWMPERAASCSPSLKSAIDAIISLNP